MALSAQAKRGGGHGHTREIELDPRAIHFYRMLLDDHGIWLVESVAGIQVWMVEDFGGAILCACAEQRAIHVQVRIGMGIDKTENQFACAARSGGRKRERRRILRRNVQGSFGAMSLEEHERVIGGCADALVAVRAFGEQERLQDVHNLRDVAHVELIGEAIEEVEPQTRGKSAAHGALLPKRAM